MGDTAPAANSPETETPSTEAAGGQETQVTETAPETTTTPTAEAPDEKGGTAAGVDSYYQEKAKLLPALKSAPPAKAVETEETPETPETPPEVTAPETSAPATPETETPETPETPESRRIRLAGLPDGHLVAAANEIARAEKIPFGDAWDRVAPKKPEPTAQQVEETTPQLRARAQVEADIAQARADRKAAAASADALEAGAASKMVETEERIEALRDELGAIEYAEAEAEAQRDTDERAEFEGIVNESKEKTIQWWPEAGDPNSDFSKRMIEIADAFENDPDPAVKAIAYEPDSPFVIGNMVAKEMGLLPNHLRKPSTNGTKPSTPAATRPAPVNQRAVGRPTQPAASPASGAARTTTQVNVVEDEIGKIRSPHEYQRFVGKLTGQKR